MKPADKGKDRVKKICEVLKKEALDPAKREAARIVTQAHCDAENIIENAKREAHRIFEEAKEKIKKEKSTFKASMNIACKKGFDTLKQQIEDHLFNEELHALFDQKMKDVDVVAKLISVIVNSIEKEGVDADLEAVIPSSLSVEAVNRVLVKGVIDRLRSKSVKIGDVSGGVQVKIVDRGLTIDMSDKALKMLLSGFLREDFRSMLFSSSTESRL